MKIALLLSHYIQIYIGNFIEICHKNNVEVDVFKFENFVKELPANKVYTITTKWESKNFKTNKAIEEEIKKLVNIDDYDYFISDVIGLSFKNSCNVFHIHTTKYIIKHTYSNIFKLISELRHSKGIKEESKYYKNTKLTIIGSKEMQKDYAQNANIPIEKIKIIYPGINKKAICNIPLRDTINMPYTIGASTIGFSAKGGYNILGALKILKKDFTPEEIRIKIINPGHEKQKLLNFYVKFFGLEKYVEFLPLFRDISQFYKELDCFICASKHEAFGRVIPECMNIGIPIICGSNVGASDIINDRINGYIYNADRDIYKNIADTIKEVMKNRNNNSYLLKNAKETAKDISWDHFAEQLFNEIYSAHISVKN